ncbi:MAG TPA: adenylate/guanylate cyclase domain-containing protein, partial [Saprospiraceae bacterium]|nr:adenylate/guanylate cyclase domain-containing protein [Saprospiraceae bacterium]
MSHQLAQKLKSLGMICLMTSFAGVVYQLIGERRLDYNSVLYGLPLGIVFGVLELFLFPKADMRFRQWSFTRMLIVKTLSYTSVIYVVTVGLTAAIGLMEGRSWSEIPGLLIYPGVLIVVFYTLVIYGLLLFFLQITRLLGKGVLWKFIIGKYHKPREEERIFMFLDMKSSTTIAEQLGHVRFYNLLNELFHEISQPVLQTKAEIYQYVGDEVVLTWELEQGLMNSNCLKTFFLFQENLTRNREQYFNNFGVRPEFKAGLHFGKVVSAQIGDLKREIVYNGDVVNTASRIQNECNTYQRDCLISGELMNRL